MTAPTLARVCTGINTKTFKPIYYVEARFSARHRWSKLTDGKKWLWHRSKPAAEREARSMQRRLSQ